MKKQLLVLALFLGGFHALFAQQSPTKDSVATVHLYSIYHGDSFNHRVRINDNERFRLKAKEVVVRTVPTGFNSIKVRTPWLLRAQFDFEAQAGQTYYLRIEPRPDGSGTPYLEVLEVTERMFQNDQKVSPLHFTQK